VRKSAHSVKVGASFVRAYGHTVAMAVTREPTRFGRYLLDRMSGKGMHQQVDLVNATGISPATVSRLIYSDEYTPDVRTLERLGAALDVPAAELVSRRSGGEPGLRVIPAVLAELIEMVDPDSPLTTNQRRRLEQMLELLAETNRAFMHSERSNGND